MTSTITVQQLIDGPRCMRPHVVLLGAGASRAAFPNGDANGKPIPIMNDLVDTLDLRPLINEAWLGTGRDADFEVIYSRLVLNSNHTYIVREVERRVEKYFSNLSLPYEATLYDRLLVSLLPRDAVVPFNWDPFLFDAYQRNRYAVPLPELFFLRGNVRIGACALHDCWGARNERCLECFRQFSDVPLFYPDTEKNYSSNPYIRRNRDAARSLFSEAFTITIFG